MARYLKSQQQQIDALLNDSSGAAPRDAKLQIAPRRSIRSARARKSGGVKHSR